MSIDHYENFPVASRLLPARWRAAVVALYHFARYADDLADEGEASSDSRLAALRTLARSLDSLAIAQASGSTPVWPANAPAQLLDQLYHAVVRHELPLAPLHRLLLAFQADVRHRAMQSRAQLLAYCEYSANPVGELLLHLYSRCEAATLALSNHICTGLQLVNFCQDVAIDLARQRYYLPADDLARWGLTLPSLPAARHSPAFRHAMAEQTAWAREQLLRGAPLAGMLPGRVGWELRLVVLGGLRILERIDAVAGNVFDHRPQLGRADWLLLAARLPRYARMQSSLK